MLVAHLFSDSSRHENPQAHADRLLQWQAFTLPDDMILVPYPLIALWVADLYISCSDHRDAAPPAAQRIFKRGRHSGAVHSGTFDSGSLRPRRAPSHGYNRPGFDNGDPDRRAKSPLCHIAHHGVARKAC